MGKTEVKLLAPAGLALTLVGCATTSGVLPFGKDTYTITVADLMGPASAQKGAITQATEHCAGEGKLLSPVSTQTSTSPGGESSYQLVFRCLDEDDPEYTRPNWGPSPDVVIENRS